MFKKGQAALEFLTTYGWAFLVILVMIGALAYFGVLNPSKFVPDTCTFGSVFLCDDAVIKTSDTNGGAANAGSVVLRLRNNIEQITITGINVSDLDSADHTDATAATGIFINGVDLNTAPIVIQAGQVFDLNVSGPTDANWDTSEGAKKKVSVKIDYYENVGFDKQTGGDVVGTIQP